MMSKSCTRGITSRALALAISATLIVPTILPVTSFATSESIATDRVSSDMLANLGAPPATYVSGEVIVKLREGSREHEQDLLLDEVGADSVTPLSSSDDTLVRVTLEKGIGVAEAIGQLEAERIVESAQPNFIYGITATPNDPAFLDGSLWWLENRGLAGATTNADIDAPEAWAKTTGSQNVVVAVVDTGVDYVHPDLAQNMWRNPSEVDGNGIDDDGNGYIDDGFGCNVVERGSSPLDDNGHGTHAAGVIGGVGNNGIGGTGVNWSVSIMAVKALDRTGYGTTAQVIEGINYAAANGADIINCSWGDPGNDEALYQAIKSVDALMVCAAGNTGANLDVSPYSPGSFDLPNMLTVGASDDHDLRTSSSGFGARNVDLFAPGAQILSTRPTQLGNLQGMSSGTSAATAVVSGVAALALAADSTMGPSALRNHLIKSTDRIDSLIPLCVSGGRISASLAVGADSSPATPIGQASVQGRVTADGSMSGVPGVVISAKLGGTVLAGVTNSGSDGSYSLSGLAPGSYAISFSKSGFVYATYPNAVMSEGAITTINVAMKAAARSVVLTTPRIGTASVRAKRSFGVAGSVKAQFRAGTTPIRAYFYRKNSSGGYSLVKVVALKATTYKSGFTAATARTSLPTRGSYRVRLYYPAQVLPTGGVRYARTFGPYKTLTVR